MHTISSATRHPIALLVVSLMFCLSACSRVGPDTSQVTAQAAPDSAAPTVPVSPEDVEATIRKNLPQRLPEFPKIDEVTKTPVPGLWEVRIGNEVLYTDADGSHIFEGELIDTKNKANLTRARIAKLTAIKFDDLPIKDAMVIKQGNGSRKLAVFADPNCGYCKRLERDLVALKDVTIYNFVYPVLGPDSDVKSRAIWCSKDAMKTWRDWMIDGVAPPRAMGQCNDAAIARTIEYGKKHRINGTPAIIFENGDRVPGALPAAELAKRLDEAKKPKS